VAIGAGEVGFDLRSQLVGQSLATSSVRGTSLTPLTPRLAGSRPKVVVVNAEKVHVSGNKETDKIYFSHSGYPGGLRADSLEHVRAKHPERLIEHAVKGMIPKNRLGRKILTKLKVYAGPDHPHQAQQPETLELKYRKAGA